MDFANKLQRFCRKYAATYRATSKKQRYMTRAPFTLEAVQAHGGGSYDVEEEQIVSVEMPVSALKTLVDFCEQTENTSFNQYVLQTLEQIQKDAQVHHRNAGVREAYKRYKVLLELAR